MSRFAPGISASLVAAVTVSLVLLAAAPASAAESVEGGSISGTVTSSVGGRLTQPVVVYARLDAGPPDSRRMAWSDSLTGKYTINDLPTGNYIVEFYPLVTDIFVPQYEEQLFDGVHLESEATVLPVAPGRAIQGIDASMEYEEGAGVYDPTAALPCIDPRDPSGRTTFAQEFELRFGTVRNVTRTNVRTYLARCTPSLALSHSAR